jgi:regulator of sirC expression with transglutaminase-like and TPR domain
VSDAAAAARRALDAAGELPDDELDLAGTALHFARIDRPDLDWDAARAELSGLVAEAIEALAPGAAAPAAAVEGIAAVLHGRHGFEGDRASYDHPDNANLLAVLRRRRGLPVALGILWLHLGEAAGVPCHGLDVPGHFLIGLGVPGRRVICDPFDRGRAVAAEPPLVPAARSGIATQPMERRAVLLRLQNNIKLRRLHAGDLAGAAACAADMLRLAPASAPLWLEAAELEARLGHAEAALRSLDRALALPVAGPLGSLIATRGEALRRRLAGPRRPLRDGDARRS